MCIADPASKKYIDFPSTMNFPKHFTFSCIYKCKDSEGEEHSILGVTKVKVGQANPNGNVNIMNQNLASESKLVVCEGVKVKKVSWGWDFDKVESIYSRSSITPELKQWGKENIGIDNPEETKKLNELKDKLLISGESYLIAGRGRFQFRYFEEAGLLLTKIANQLPNDTRLLEKTISDCKILRSINTTTKMGLVCGQINILAAWKF